MGTWSKPDPAAQPISGRPQPSVLWPWRRVFQDVQKPLQPQETPRVHLRGVALVALKDRGPLPGGWARELGATKDAEAAPEWEPGV